MERLVKTYLTHKNKNDRGYTWMTHHSDCHHVNTGSTATELRNTYNFKPKGDTPFRLASTQVISKSFGITQEHEGMEYKPWERANGFKIIP